MARAINCWVCRGPHSKTVHRIAKGGKPSRRAKPARGKGAKRRKGGTPAASALWKTVNAIIDRLGEHKLSDATAPMKTGGFFSVRPRYALEFARDLRRARVPFRQKLVAGSVVFYLSVPTSRVAKRRNPDGHAFRVIAHGRNGEVAYRGRELHRSYGAAWAEARVVARRRGLTDVHVVKDGESLVGELKARRNPSAGDRYKMVHSRPHGWHHLWKVIDTKTGKVLVEDETYAVASQACEGFNGRTRGVSGEIREWARPNPRADGGDAADCRLCGDGISEEEVEDGKEYRYGLLCWPCDFEKHSGISDLNRDRSYGPPVFDGTWRRYGTKHELKAAYRRGRI